MEDPEGAAGEFRQAETLGSRRRAVEQRQIADAVEAPGLGFSRSQLRRHEIVAAAEHEPIGGDVAEPARCGAAVVCEPQTAHGFDRMTDSREHRFVLEGAGTRLNGDRLSMEQRLHVGDELAQGR